MLNVFRSTSSRITRLLYRNFSTIHNEGNYTHASDAGIKKGTYFADSPKTLLRNTNNELNELIRKLSTVSEDYITLVHTEELPEFTLNESASKVLQKPLEKEKKNLAMTACKLFDEICELAFSTNVSQGDTVNAIEQGLNKIIQFSDEETFSFSISRFEHQFREKNIQELFLMLQCCHTKDTTFNLTLEHLAWIRSRSFIMEKEPYKFKGVQMRSLCKLVANLACIYNPNISSSLVHSNKDFNYAALYKPAGKEHFSVILSQTLKLVATNPHLFTADNDVAILLMAIVDLRHPTDPLAALNSAFNVTCQFLKDDQLKFSQHLSTFAFFLLHSEQTFMKYLTLNHIKTLLHYISPAILCPPSPSKCSTIESPPSCQVRDIQKNIDKLNSDDRRRRSMNAIYSSSYQKPLIGLVDSEDKNFQTNTFSSSIVTSPGTHTNYLLNRTSSSSQSPMDDRISAAIDFDMGNVLKVGFCEGLLQGSTQAVRVQRSKMNNLSTFSFQSFETEMLQKEFDKTCELQIQDILEKSKTKEIQFNQETNRHTILKNNENNTKEVSKMQNPLAERKKDITRVQHTRRRKMYNPLKHRLIFKNSYLIERGIKGEIARSLASILQAYKVGRRIEVGGVLTGKSKVEFCVLP